MRILKDSGEQTSEKEKKTKSKKKSDFSEKQSKAAKNSPSKPAQVPSKPAVESTNHSVESSKFPNDSTKPAQTGAKHFDLTIATSTETLKTTKTLENSVIETAERKRKSQSSESPSKKTKNVLVESKIPEKEQQGSDKKKKLVVNDPLPESLKPSYLEFVAQATKGGNFHVLLIESESFEVKKTFPPLLRVSLKKLVLEAHSIDYLNDNLLAHVLEHVPYNTLTIRVSFQFEI